MSVGACVCGGGCRGGGDCQLMRGDCQLVRGDCQLVRGDCQLVRDDCQLVRGVKCIDLAVSLS